MENGDIKQIVSRLVKDNTEMITACFDEYFFVIPEGVIKPHPVNAKVYHIGESVPVKGETYEFPSNFNIIDLHYNKVAKIRESKLYDIETIDEFEFDNYPALNMMGFAIKLETVNDFTQFKSHYKTFNLSERGKLADFANKWFEIVKYRSIRYF